MTEADVRFYHGVAFQFFMLFCFLTNICIVAVQAGPQLILKLKRLKYKFKHRQEVKMLDKFFDREERIIVCHE